MGQLVLVHFRLLCKLDGNMDANLAIARTELRPYTEWKIIKESSPSMPNNSDHESMSSVDNAWLRMDRPYNHMSIVGVIILADRLDLERLKQHIETRMLIYKRFKQRPVYHSTGTYWETDTHFELSSHIRRVGLPGARGKEELKEFVSNLVSTPMDPTKPM